MNSLRWLVVTAAVFGFACTGSPGPEGVAGSTGPTGPQGTPGPQGVPGPTGVMGATGPQGLVGPVGEVGPTGPMGIQGIAGVQGATGATGPQGPPGMVVTGPGLVGVGDSTSPLGVDFSGTGAAATAARSDHLHPEYGFTPGSGLALNGTVFSVDSAGCSANQSLTWNGTQWACASGLGASGVANKLAFFTGTSSLGTSGDLHWEVGQAQLGVGTATPSGRVQIVGTATAAGTGLVSASSGTTALSGAGTDFVKEAGIGSVIATTGSCAGTGQTRTVSAIGSGTTLTLSAPWTSNVINCTFTVTRPALHAGGAAGSTDLIVNGRGDVGIGTATPAAKLDVAGEILGTPAVVMAGPAAHDTSTGTGWTNSIATDTVLLNTSPSTFTMGAAGITVNRPGYYEIEVRSLSSCPAGTVVYLRALVNGIHAGYLGYGMDSEGAGWRERKGSRVMLLAAGAVVTFQVYNNVTCSYRVHSLNGDSDYSWLRITRLN